eukprot:scaffold24292_cov29-Phaeocystis_antarctica.AAC.1
MPSSSRCAHLRLSRWPWVSCCCSLRSLRPPDLPLVASARVSASSCDTTTSDPWLLPMAPLPIGSPS